jgi:hypothetical protein
MKELIVSVLVLAAFSISQSRANDAKAITTRPLSVSALKQLLIAPRIFTVTAYVIEKYDECPPCPPRAVCETCAYGIYLSDENHPRKPGTLTDDGLYLRTNRAKEFEIGTKYRFRVRYRMEKSAAGAWRQSGPELIDFTRQ